MKKGENKRKCRMGARAYSPPGAYVAFFIHENRLFPLGGLQMDSSESDMSSSMQTLLKKGSKLKSCLNNMLNQHQC